jgi:hypothetical protein
MLTTQVYSRTKTNQTWAVAALSWKTTDPAVALKTIASVAMVILSLTNLE